LSVACTGLFAAQGCSYKGRVRRAIFFLCNFPHIQRQFEASAVPVKAGAPAKQDNACAVQIVQAREDVDA
ncbi:hypothetical protein ACGLHT_25955, partial [Pseudomonas sp. PsB]|uniref:hypothetical protein n=1 Tax=Pseudomonas sp. PsB TaxID=89774 RepID=UPI002E7EE599|nr:hypothetical protein [Pseudomonas inefficax]